MKVKLEKLEVSDFQKESLPIFYGYVSYNNFIEREEGAEDRISFSERLNCYIDHPPSDKLISKIINFSKIN